MKHGNYFALDEKNSRRESFHKEYLSMIFPDDEARTIPTELTASPMKASADEESGTCHSSSATPLKRAICFEIDEKGCFEEKQSLSKYPSKQDAYFALIDVDNLEGKVPKKGRKCWRYLICIIVALLLLGASYLIFTFAFPIKEEINLLNGWLLRSGYDVVVTPQLTTFNSEHFVQKDKNIMFKTHTEQILRTNTELYEAADTGDLHWSPQSGKHVLMVTASVQQITKCTTVAKLWTAADGIIRLCVSKKSDSEELGRVMVYNDYQPFVLSEEYKIGSPISFKFIVQSSHLDVYFNFPDRPDHSFELTSVESQFRIGASVFDEIFGEGNGAAQVNFQFWQVLHDFEDI